MSQPGGDPDVPDDGDSPSRSQNGGWASKFANAFAGVAYAVRNENSFYVHLPIAVIVILTAILLQMDLVQIAVLLLCIGFVFATELINTAFEALADSVTSEYRESIKRALDVSAGAVLVASLTSVIVGVLMFGSHLFAMWTTGTAP